MEEGRNEEMVRERRVDIYGRGREGKGSEGESCKGRGGGETHYEKSIGKVKELGVEGMGGEGEAMGEGK